MSKNIMKKTSSIFNFVELLQRKWEFFKEDHLLSLILTMVTASFIKMIFTREWFDLIIFGLILITLIFATFWKYYFDLQNRKQRLLEEKQDAELSMERVNSWKQIRTIDLMVQNNFETSQTLIHGAFTELKKLDTNHSFNSHVNSVDETLELLRGKIKLYSMNYKEFIIKFYGGDKLEADEPRLDNLPRLDSDELVSELQQSKLIDSNDISIGKKTKEIKDYHPDTHELNT
ncbi:MAG: hypothetical protein V3V19_11210 [Cocleimonas sp.]